MPAAPALKDSSATPKPSKTVTNRGLAAQTLRGLRISHRVHRQCATTFEARGRWLGVGAATLSAVAGTAIISSAATSDDPQLKVIAAVLSVAAAIGSALQAALKYMERSVQHTNAAQRYGALRRELEELLAELGSTEPPSFAKDLRALRQRWTEVDEAAPRVPQAWYERVEREISDS